MIIGFGKHNGRTTEQLVLREPDYVSWLLSKPDLSGRAVAVRQDIHRLLKTFDTKPFVKKCAKCRKPATYGTAYIGNVPSFGYWWCGDCNPYSSGAYPGMLRRIRTYHDALEFVESCGGSKTDYKAVIAKFVDAKGVQRPITAKNAANFFA